ncbi:MAG: ATP-dependent helicase [Rhodospirillales bacterium]|nr:ATP-dependent helicase [Rhodospirillales bacterium]
MKHPLNHTKEITAMTTPFKVLTPNRYAGSCATCATPVGAGKGVAVKATRDAKWAVTCSPCHNGTEPTPKVADLADRPSFDLTDEQEAALSLFRQGKSIAVQAGAGTGKTSTLVAIAKSTTRTGAFVAFNSAIVRDAAAKLPGNVTASTAHSLAFRQVGKHYRARLNSSRQSSAEIARRLSIDPCVVQVGGAPKVLQPSALAGYVMKAIGTFCNSADRVPEAKHFPYVKGIDLPDDEGNRTWENQDIVREHLADALSMAWEDIQRTDGELRFTHDNYLKLWELGYRGQPVIPGDFILFDEAQDASPVLLSVVEQQDKQVVFVGDAQQAIYEWRGAVDAMSTVPADSTAYLTNSFRFGPEIADVANKVLACIPSAVLRLTGKGADGTVDTAENPDAILTRTNAGSVAVVLQEVAAGRTAHLVGGSGEIESFAKAAEALMAGQPTSHPELCIFDSWTQVQAYASEDVLGGELAPMVKLIDQYGVATVLRAVSTTVSEEDADVVVSTAHKAKGREWDTVRLHGDFPTADRMADEEYRLLYVAVTRARLHLDITGCEVATEIVNPD